MTQSCAADVSDGAARHVALSVAYISFRILTLAGSIYLAMKIAFFDYHALGNSGATACAVLMIVGSLVALWVESVIPYVLTAARIPDADDSHSLVCSVLLKRGLAFVVLLTPCFCLSVRSCHLARQWLSQRSRRQSNSRTKIRRKKWRDRAY